MLVINEQPLINLNKLCVSESCMQKSQIGVVCVSRGAPLIFTSSAVIMHSIWVRLYFTTLNGHCKFLIHDTSLSRVSGQSSNLQDVW